MKHIYVKHKMFAILLFAHNFIFKIVTFYLCGDKEVNCSFHLEFPHPNVNQYFKSDNNNLKEKSDILFT
jgi:hypothetical protein